MSELRLADLIGCHVERNGARVGRVVDLEVDASREYALVALVVGRQGWLDRLNVRHGPSKIGTLHGSDRIPWTHVEAVEGTTITLRATDGHPDQG